VGVAGRRGSGQQKEETENVIGDAEASATAAGWIRLGVEETGWRVVYRVCMWWSTRRDEQRAQRPISIFSVRHTDCQRRHIHSYLNAYEAQNCGVCAWRAATRRSRARLCIPPKPSNAATPVLNLCPMMARAAQHPRLRPPILRPARLASVPPT
jgi:hypothetical protein